MDSRNAVTKQDFAATASIGRAYSRREAMCLGKARHALRKWKKSPAAEPQEIFGSVKIHLDKSGRAGYNALVVPNWAIAKW
jgi:hypothetical protein